MNLNFLDFEQPIAELQQKIEELRYVADGSEVNLTEEIQKLEGKITTLTEQIFSSLTPWQIAQLARLKLGRDWRIHLNAARAEALSRCVGERNLRLRFRAALELDDEL